MAGIIIHWEKVYFISFLKLANIYNLSFRLLRARVSGTLQTFTNHFNPLIDSIK